MLSCAQKLPKLCVVCSLCVPMGWFSHRRLMAFNSQGGRCGCRAVRRHLTSGSHDCPDPEMERAMGADGEI